VRITVGIHDGNNQPSFRFRSSNNFGNLQRSFRDQLGKQSALLTVTFDSVHDSPEALTKYATIWKADPGGWHFLTGCAGDIQLVCDRFGVDFFPTKPEWTALSILL
jgi:cytochrome oxidase Cu insertion factor (SCO1/SenC/PrrC family)